MMFKLKKNLSIERHNNEKLKKKLHTQFLEMRHITEKMHVYEGFNFVSIDSIFLCYVTSILNGLICIYSVQQEQKRNRRSFYDRK